MTIIAFYYKRQAAAFMPLMPLTETRNRNEEEMMASWIKT